MYLCLHYTVERICIRHVANGQGAYDIRDIPSVVTQCGLGFYIVKLPILKIKFQVISKIHLVQIMHNENKKVSAYLRYTLVWSIDREMLPHPNQ
jgi:hypothetical protein